MWHVLQWASKVCFWTECIEARTVGSRGALRNNILKLQINRKVWTGFHRSLFLIMSDYRALVIHVIKSWEKYTHTHTQITSFLLCATISSLAFSARSLFRQTMWTVPPVGSIQILISELIGHNVDYNKDFLCKMYWFDCNTLIMC